jgi:hypothetical protein
MAKYKPMAGEQAETKKKEGMGCSQWMAIALLGICGVIGILMVLPRSNNADRPRRTEAPARDTEIAEATDIPLPTDTLISATSRRIEDVFLGINVVSVELASEVERENQINGLAMVTIEDDANLYVVRDSLWTTWVYHAQRTYSDDKRLVLDLTIIQAGTESIWQRTSGETRWLQLGGTVPTVEAQKTGLTSLPRPDNCDEAVAWGYTAQQAAQWSHLDRDGDGVACYGD